jgi:hypothetical protein
MKEKYLSPEIPDARYGHTGTKVELLDSSAWYNGV